MSGNLSSMWLLRASDPVYLREHGDPDGSRPSRRLRCDCGGADEWLIVADEAGVLMVCRCGRRQRLDGATLDQVVALAREEPVRPEWTALDDALRALGFTGDAPRGSRANTERENKRQREAANAAGKSAASQQGATPTADSGAAPGGGKPKPAPGFEGAATGIPGFPTQQGRTGAVPFASVPKPGLRPEPGASSEPPRLTAFTDAAAFADPGRAPGNRTEPGARRSPVLGFHAPRWWRAFGIRPYRHTAPMQ